AARRAEYKPPRTLVPKKKSSRVPGTQPALLPPPPPLEALAAPPIVDAPPRLEAHLFDDVELPPPDADDPILTEARKLVREGKAEAAHAVLAPLCANRPADAAARALAHVAAALSAPDRGEQARSELEQALVDDPNCAEAAALLDGLEDAQAAQRHSLLAPILPDASGAPGKREIVDAIVLAFSRSEL